MHQAKHLYSGFISGYRHRLYHTASTSSSFHISRKHDTAGLNRIRDTARASLQSSPVPDQETHVNFAANSRKMSNMYMLNNGLVEGTYDDNKKMRIAILAPLWETVPPKRYGGTECVVHFLTLGLVAAGHEVTLYACKGSQTSGTLIEGSPKTLRELGYGPLPEDVMQVYTEQFMSAFNADPPFDIVHVHHGTHVYHPDLIEQLGTKARAQNTAVVWTDHCALDDGIKCDIFDELALLGVGVTALSKCHMSTFPGGNWLDIILHGLPKNLLVPQPVSTPSYLAFLGRISPEKGITTAVRIADGAGLPLKVAAKIDVVDVDFYNREVKHLFESSGVDFIGEIGEVEKQAFLSSAIALIFPISWLEPFGLVMIEAMACGCPVIAFRMGSVPEIIEDGITGFIVDTEEEAIEALEKIGTLDRAMVRQRFEERFTADTMAGKYISVYRRAILAKRTHYYQQAAAARARFANGLTLLRVDDTPVHRKNADKVRTSIAPYSFHVPPGAGLASDDDGSDRL